MSLQLLRDGGRFTWFLGIWKPGFRMAYLYSRRGYSLSVGLLNGRPEFRFQRTHWHPSRRAGIA